MRSDFWKQGHSSVYGQECGGGFSSQNTGSSSQEPWVQFLAIAGSFLLCHSPHNSVYFSAEIRSSKSFGIRETTPH